MFKNTVVDFLSQFICTRSVLPASALIEDRQLWLYFQELILICASPFSFSFVFCFTNLYSFLLSISLKIHSVVIFFNFLSWMLSNQVLLGADVKMELNVQDIF